MICECQIPYDLSQEQLQFKDDELKPIEMKAITNKGLH